MGYLEVIVTIGIILTVALLYGIWDRLDKILALLKQQVDRWVRKV